LELPAIIAAISALDHDQLPAVAMALAARMASSVKSTPAAAEDELLDVNEAAALLGVSPSWLHHRPNLPFRRKIGGKLKFSRQGIERWRQKDHHTA
jgi:predicted DNA-binding transcriptional regulator AlpA